MKSLCAWEDFYEKAPYSSGLRIVHASPGDFYVFATLFGPMNSGTTIDFYPSGSGSKLLIETVIFQDCASGSTGGAVYFSTEGTLFMTKTCSAGCYGSSGANGNLIYSSIINNPKNPNCFMMSSCCRCGIPSNGKGSVYMQYGAQNISSLNMSQNQASDRSCIFSESANGEMNTKYCLFFENKASSDYCLYYSGGSQYIITQCNLINNQQNNNLIYSSSVPMTVSTCFIMNNTGIASIFFGSAVTFENSFVFLNSADTIGNIKTQINIKTNSFITHQMQLIVYEKCNLYNLFNNDYQQFSSIKLISCRFSGILRPDIAFFVLLVYVNK